MEFREMSKEMSDHEVKICMSILIDGSVVLDIKRDIVGNGIDIKFRVIGDPTQRVYEMGLNPKGFEDIPEGVSLRIDAEYYLVQFLVAKGYSEYWMSNFFVDEF